ncbi:PfkB family carbohydrate kinase [Jannaschia sp. S6380]|uniref:PfkB family carbohydrate kinase n=1 Tax=Jannaschia sp. S6380 TaxID=2926408 RepID=UPI001FF3EB32|nr:PfkB family carbohydrate kinase [Jannaschia sp. S6380]MCK0167979.1 PfkB family carbohydrate kinase [Jannaschia sp. S6380]
MTRLLVCGIAVMDYVHRMDALPSGGAKHRSHAFDRIGGGCAANAAVGAARLGAEVTLMARLGRDATGDELAAMLEDAGVTPALARGGRTPLSSVMVDAAGERMIVNFPGADLPTTPPPIPGFDAALTDCRWPEAAGAVLRGARDRDLPGVLDGEKYTPEPLAALASHVVFSAPGLRDFTGIDALGPALADAARRLPGRVAYTDGPDGVVWAGGPHIPAPKVAVVDTLGAGDLWHGAFALALGRRQGLDAASHFANRAAAIKCTRAGGWEVYPTAHDLEERCP